MNRPVVFTWMDGAMVPLRRFDNLCAAQFDEGKNYTLVELELRSMKSHRHYFACIGEAWSNLPEHLAPRFPSAEHLRKWSLIKSGWLVITKIVTANNQEAMKTAGWARKTDPFCVITVDDNIVTINVARSQKVKRGGNDGMTPKEFQQSKTETLAFLDEVLQVESGQVAANAGNGA